MTSAGSVTVDVNGRDVGLAALLTRLEAAMRRADAVGQRLGQATGGQLAGAMGRAAGSTTQAASSALSLASADARLLRDQGNLVASAQRLRDALAGISSTSVQTINAQRQLLAVENQLATGQTRLAQTLSQAGSAAKASFTGMIGPAALAGGAIAAATAIVNSFADAFKFKAELDATTASINAQLKGVRDTSQVYAEAARFANQFKLTQQETTQAIAASIGVMRNSKAPVEDILGVLARLQVLSPEQSLQEAAVAVKALASGDTTSLVTRFEVGRDVAGQMKKEIAGGADAVAVLNKFLNNTGIGMDALAAKTTGASGAMKDVARAQEDLALAQAKFAEGPGMVILETKTRALVGLTRILTGDFQAMGQSIISAVAPTGPALEGLKTNITELTQRIALMDPTKGAALEGVTAQILRVGASSPEAAANVQALAGSFAAGDISAQQLQIVLSATEQSILATAQASVQAGGASIYQSQAMIDAANATDAARVAAEAEGSALAEQIAKSQQSTIEGQKLAQINATLAQLGPAVAGGLQTAGSAAAFLAARYNIATGEALKLIQAQATIAGQAAKLSPSQSVREDRLDRDTPADRALVGTNKALEANRQLLASLNAVGKATKAGGAARISDQAKLSNKLLTQQETFADQAEQAERAHQQKLLDIEKDFQKRSLEQQRANEVGKRQSRADFYDSLTSATKDLGPKEAQALSAAYEEAYAKSQEIAQAGQQKLAADYLAFKQKEIQAEIDYQKARAAAAKDGDKGEVGRLDAIHKLHQDAAAEEEKQLLAGGDANVNQKNEALTEEEQRQLELHDKNALAAEQKAQRTVTAAQREGKAVKDVNDLLTTQEQTLARIGATPGGGGVAVPTGAAAAVVATGATPPADALAGLKDALIGALAAIERATNAAGDKVAGAVGRIGSQRLTGA